MTDAEDEFQAWNYLTLRTDSARTPRTLDRVLTPVFALSYLCLFGFGGNMVKKSNLVTLPFCMVMIASLAGCAGEAWTGDDARELPFDSVSYYPESPSSQSIVITNSLEPWVLVPNDLALYPLSLAALPAASVSQLQGPTGVNLRRLLQYIVGCALPGDEHFDFDWRDVGDGIHHEKLRGDVGLAPNWKNVAMNVGEQEWVSACLAARSNWYGEQVRISMRGSLENFAVNDGEYSNYVHREGAFWGNLFAPVPFLNACFDSNNVLYARSKHRECATGHFESGAVYECGMISIGGTCQQACSSVDADGYYSNCSVEQDGTITGLRTNRVINVLLR